MRGPGGLTLGPHDLAAVIDDVQVVDVRQPHEWEAGRIEGSRHIPSADLEERPEQLDAARRVVTVCRSGSRSGDAARFLRDNGFRAENLDGGLLAWVDAGLPLTTPDGAPGTVADPQPSTGDDLAADPDFQAQLMSLAIEIQEHFGDHEPSETEVQGYLREKMIQEGHSPEEADEVLARIAPPPGDSSG